MNKRELKHMETEASDRVQMRQALKQTGYESTGNESTEFLEEMVVLAFAPIAKPFTGLATRAKEAME